MKNNKLVTGLIITIGVLFALIIFLVLNHEELGGGSIDKEFYVLYNEKRELLTLAFVLLFYFNKLNCFLIYLMLLLLSV